MDVCICGAADYFFLTWVNIVGCPAKPVDEAKGCAMLGTK